MKYRIMTALLVSFPLAGCLTDAQFEVVLDRVEDVGEMASITEDALIVSDCGQHMAAQLDQCPAHNGLDDFNLTELVVILRRTQMENDSESTAAALAYAFADVHDACVRSQYEEGHIQETEMEARLRNSQNFRTALARLEERSIKPPRKEAPEQDVREDR